MEFKDKLKILRKSKYLSQEALAKELFVSRSLVARWEAGLCLPTNESLDKIAEYFAVDKDSLIEKNISSEKLVEKNITINKFKKRLIFSLIGIVLLIIISSYFIYRFINDKPEYIDMTPTITKIEFIPVYDERCVDDLNYGIEDSLDIPVINHNENMTKVISKTLGDYNNTLQNNKYFLHSGGNQKVKIYFANPYNVDFYQVTLSSKNNNSGYSQENQKIQIVDDYILIDDFFVYEDGLLNLELKVIAHVNWKNESGAGNIKECYYLFDNKNIEVYIGDVYSYSYLSNVVVRENVEFEISSKFNPGSYGKLLIYDSNCNKVDEYVFDTEKNAEKYIYEMTDSYFYYYVMLIITDTGGSIYEPVVLVTDYGLFKKDIYDPIVREFLVGNDLYIKINYSYIYNVKQILIYEGNKKIATLKDFEEINGVMYAIQRNYDKKAQYKYYVIYEFEEENIKYNLVNLGISTLGSSIDDLTRESVDILYADILDIEITSDISNLKIGDEIRIKVTLENLPDKEYIKCGMFGNFPNEGVVISENSYVVYVTILESGKVKIGFNYLSYIGEYGYVEYVYFNEMKFIDIYVNE